MTARRLLFMASLSVVACGKKADDVNTPLGAVSAAVGAAGAMQEGAQDAEKFYNDRKAKGDTVAMPYAELNKLQASAPGGFKADGGPKGSQQNMPGFSMSQSEQEFSGTAASDGSQPRITVTIMDLGGTQMGYSMMALPMMMGVSSEDDHHRSATLKSDVPYTWGYEEFNKDSKDTKVTLVTRYRFMITVDARSQGSDQSAMVKSLAEDVAKKFADK